MVQSRGYNALSFRELGKEVGVKSASIHYHFPTKDDLAVALARRYTEDLNLYLQQLTATVTGVHDRMTAYAEIFRGALLKSNRMCLCGMLAAERDDLSAEVQAEVSKFNAANVSWLSEVLAAHDSSMSTDATQRRAFAILSAIEGAQLVARGCGDIRVYDRTIEAYRDAGLIP
jgi:TetR/AcrR family transcriptional repressor of nem operon